MKNQHVTLTIMVMTLFIILCAGIAGCASQAPSSPTATQQKLSTIEPSQMALQPSDVPAGFTLLEKYERNVSDMRSWALDKGWKKGYGVYYESSGPEVRGLDQVISVYPAENITLIVPDTVQNIRTWVAEENLSFEELPAPGVGDSSSALKVSEKDDPINQYVIAFVKYDVFEQLSVNGTATDYDTLKQLAGTAAGKIK
ncbi:MAG: hypothetical protein M0Q92_06170 [Methanoregula sp.]|jgi:hypothetical protein|nr:hypothetical protein [Methanoregula sp.]